MRGRDESEELERYRPKLVGIAYRMLGEVGRAEDVVQESYLRLHRQSVVEGEQIDSPEAYLVTLVTRLSIDELRSARAQREFYVGEWLPEPLVADPSADPAREVEIAEALSLSFVVVLETLSPEQRAVFLLRDVFDYPYERIAEILDKREDAVRQIAVGRGATSRNAGPGSSRAPNSRRRSPRGSSRPSPKARSASSRHSWPGTSSSMATAAATPPLWHGRSSVVPGSRGRSSTGARRPGALRSISSAGASTAILARRS